MIIIECDANNEKKKKLSNIDIANINIQLMMYLYNKFFKDKKINVQLWQVVCIFK